MISSCVTRYSVIVALAAVVETSTNDNFHSCEELEMPKKKDVTAKSLGLMPSTKLSATYANTKTNFKVVDNHVLGFMVFGNDRSGYQIIEILRADIHTKQGQTRHISSSWEYGQRLVADPDNADFTHDNNMARMVDHLIAMLQERADRRNRENKERNK